MTQRQGHETPNLPIGKWVLWGLLAILVLVIGYIAVSAFLVSNDESPEGTPTTIRPQVEWSIVLTDGNGSEVTLKGDEPVGFPTEVWVDGSMMGRQVGNTFEWTMDAEPPVPTAVYDIDRIVADNEGDPEAMCEALGTSVEEWVAATESAAGGQARTWHEAFVQHAVNTFRDNGCQA
jgi:hypothetical protein